MLTELTVDRPGFQVPIEVFWPELWVSDPPSEWSLIPGIPSEKSYGIDQCKQPLVHIQESLAAPYAVIVEFSNYLKGS